MCAAAKRNNEPGAAGEPSWYTISDPAPCLADGAAFIKERLGPRWSCQPLP